MRAALFLLPLALLACTPVPPNPERVAERCADRAKEAEGPKTSVTLGVNSETGTFAKGSIGISSDYILGRDPYVIYENCVRRLTGQGPVIPYDIARD